MKYPQLADEKSCTGCLGCIDICPRNAIKRIQGEDGHVYVTVDEALCVGCLKCERFCKNLHDGTYADDSAVSVPFAAKSTNEDLYSRATSGGIFPAVAKYVLDKGGCVYGAAWDDNGRSVRHIRMDDIEGIHLLQGSKYMQSDTSYIYNKVLEDLCHGRTVLFVGTGCQVAAVLEYCEKVKNRHLLYTMDLVCGGVPSSLLMDRFIDNANPSFSKVVHFRDKEKYTFAYEDTGGNIVKCKKALPLDGFKSSLTSRYSCYECRFAGLHRKADWTIGDYWGDKERKGCRSLVLCHTERAKKRIEILDDVETVKMVDWSFVYNNPRIVSFPFMKGRLERRMLAWNFQHLSYKTLCKIYASDTKTWDVIWMMYKVYRLLRYKLSMYNYKKHLCKTMNVNMSNNLMGGGKPNLVIIKQLETDFRERNGINPYYTYAA